MKGGPLLQQAIYASECSVALRQWARIDNVGIDFFKMPISLRFNGDDKARIQLNVSIWTFATGYRFRPTLERCIIFCLLIIIALILLRREDRHKRKSLDNLVDSSSVRVRQRFASTHVQTVVERLNVKHSSSSPTDKSYNGPTVAVRVDVKKMKLDGGGDGDENSEDEKLDVEQQQEGEEKVELDSGMDDNVDDEDDGESLRRDEAAKRSKTTVSIGQLNGAVNRSSSSSSSPDSGTEFQHYIEQAAMQ